MTDKLDQLLRNQLIIMRALGSVTGSPTARNFLRERELETERLVGPPSIPKRCPKCTAIVLEAGECAQCQQGV